MFGQDFEETQKRETRDRILALYLSSDYEETQKRETHFVAFCIAFGLRRSNWRCGCRNGCWCTQRRDLARPNCDLYVFGSSRKHFISTHSLPTVFIRANPHRPPRPLREIRSPPFQICSLPIATIGTITIATIASYPDRGLHSPPGKGLSAPLRRGQSRSGRDTLTGGGRPRAICVNIPTYFELWSLVAEKQRRLKEI